uniref:Uncharacterized protein n=1 Tax=Anopheles dirus TaxID=7168 RepID=A0A182NXR7_9DIPT
MRLEQTVLLDSAPVKTVHRCHCQNKRGGKDFPRKRKFGTTAAKIELPVVRASDVPLFSWTPQQQRSSSSSSSTSSNYGGSSTSTSTAAAAAAAATAIMSDRDRASPTLIETGLKTLIGGRDSNYPLISGTNGE